MAGTSCANFAGHSRRRIALEPPNAAASLSSMATSSAGLLPVHDLLARVREWQADPTQQRVIATTASLERVAVAYGATGAYVEATVSPVLPRLKIAAGSFAGADAPPAGPAELRELSLSGDGPVDVRLWVDGSAAAADRLAEAVELTISAASAIQQTTAQGRQLEALDMAVRGIATLSSVDRVLQLIVNRVRDLIGAEYAALGIVGAFGEIEQFITSGVAPEVREQIGPPPRGHGLLGLIIREDRSFLIDDIAEHAQSYGFPPNHPEMHAFLGVPVHAGGRSVGNLYLTNKTSAATFSDDDMQLVERFALHAGIAIANARLHDELGRLAIVEERQRISQDLHDSIIQSLYAISLSLEEVPDLMIEDPSEVTARADRAIDSIHATIRDIRNFIMGLQPELLTDADLASGIRSLAAEFEANTLIDLELELDEPITDLDPDSDGHLLSITREALSNIARHSGASRAAVQLKREGAVLRLVISDNGRGFNAAEARSANHRGMSNLHSRADALGGDLNVTSDLGLGTQIELTIPVPATDASRGRSDGEQQSA
jgi:signal transduction histidine kinase